MTDFPRASQILIPKDFAGWGLRLILLLLVVLALGVLPFPGAELAVPAVVQTHVIYTLVVGAPLGAALFWALSCLGRAQTRVKTLSDLDPITALSNRPDFVRRAQRVLPQAGALLLVDVDDFKAINHRRGRRAGDLCLMALAQRFREVTRQSDVVGRLDGASFAIYLPGATVEQAHEISQRLCEGMIIVTPNGKLRLTTSVGAVLADGRTPLERLLRDADTALDRAKLKGRACVVIDELPLVA